MIIVGRSNFNMTFERSLFTYIQSLYKKDSIRLFFNSGDFYDIFIPKYFLVPEDKIYLLDSNNLGIYSRLYSQVQALLKNREVPLRLIQIDKTYSCIGIDFNDCLRRIDIDSSIRESLALLLRGEACSIVMRYSRNEFSELVLQEGMDNYICKDTVIKLYGDYTLENLFKFLILLSKVPSTDIKEKYLPKYTPIETELADTLLQGKILPVFRTSRKVGKAHTFKGFIPYIMINTVSQVIFANNALIYVQGKDLLNFASQGKMPFSFLDPLANRKSISFAPKTYAGKTFTFRIGKF